MPLFVTLLENNQFLGHVLWREVSSSLEKHTETLLQFTRQMMELIIQRSKAGDKEVTRKWRWRDKDAAGSIIHFFAQK